MKVQVDEITPIKKSLTVEIPEEVVSKAFSKAYADLGRRVRVPGFRPGKVPVTLLEKRYGAAVADDIIRKLVPDYYEKAVEETGIFPVEYPSFDKVEAKKGAALSFTATVEVKPAITVGNYEGIVLPKREIRVSDEDLEKALSAQQEQHSQLETRSEDHVVVSGDFVIVDFEGAVNGEPVQDGKQEGYTIQVGSKTFPPPLESELTGKKKGDELDVTVPYPQDFQNKAIAGKDVQFHVKIQEVKHKVLPALDDEFAKDLGHETLDELKEKTKETLLKQAEEKQTQDQKKALVDQLIEKNPFETPDALVARELNIIMGSFPDQKAIGEEADKRETLMKELEPLARHRVAESLILSEIVKKEAIAVTDNEVETELTQISKRRGTSLKEVKQAFHQKEGALEGLKSQLKEQKALDLIFSKAKFENVTEEEAEPAKGDKS
ncbi:MAG: trigger factor [Nitrospiria bacterium]